ncbi:MAG: HEAT repeat domain-containing protein [Ignavibacteria bacterium]|jgi:HEAT repeat protein|nr:HEAT repeat domain-containing protein [Ignavibacteria bacterium]MCU7503953.1 HEAT repeat domain-containing protein [Ignavibacteria bacterium]MCU7515826.1 HEAT repeat domain-containing protein [Ignavibacteria bacterium]
MKRIALILSGALCVLFFGFSNARANYNPSSQDEESLLKSIRSEDLNERVNSAFALGEIKSSKALIPLLNMLHSETSDGARIMAALSLYKLGKQQGLYAIERAAIFDKSERVRKMCANFYNDYLLNKKTDKPDIEEELLKAVSSDDFDARVSAAYLLGEMKSSLAMIPLMKMLREEENDGGKLMAALSLYKLGKAQGIYALRRAFEFDESSRVKRMCAIFYNTYQISEKK